MGFFCLFLFYLIFLRPINNLSVKQGLPGLNQYSARINVSCSRTKNAATPVRLKPAAPQSRVKHSTTDPLRFRLNGLNIKTNKLNKCLTPFYRPLGKSV